MFGDEPYGNYNRIMLSNVLAGVEDDDGIFLNTLSWYADNDITLHAGVRVARIDRFAKLVYAVDDGSVTPYDKLIIATGSSLVRARRSRACGRPTDAADQPGRLRLPHARRHPA